MEGRVYWLLKTCWVKLSGFNEKKSQCGEWVDELDVGVGMGEHETWGKQSDWGV